MGKCHGLKELNALERNGTWQLTSLPSDEKAL